MSPSIPASKFVNAIPSVLGTGGNPLSLNAVFATTDGSVPIGTVKGFPDVTSVENWFGAQSPEADLAGRYFSGYSIGTSLPSTLYFAQFNEAPVAAYLRSGSMSAVTLAQLQGFSGSLAVVVDGHALTSAAINLAAASSFPNAAALIQTGLQNAGNSWSGTVTTVTTSPTVTVNTTATGVLHVGDNIVAAGIPVGATILSFGTYTPGTGTGTVTLSANATASAGPIAATVTLAPTVSYDTQRAAFVITSPSTGATSTIAFATTSTFATNLKLTQAAGASLSQGAAPAVPATFLNGVVAVTQNWATFTTVFEADVDTAFGFATWMSTASPAGQERFAYIQWDSVALNALGSNPTGFGARVTAAALNGSSPNYDPGTRTDIDTETGLPVITTWTKGELAAFVCGFVASLDFNTRQGRATAMYKSQSGVQAGVNDATQAANLAGFPYGSGGNGYNFYGAVATANEDDTFYVPGSMPGAWKWLDPYINQIAMNSDFQLALLTLERQVPSIPYNTNGYNLVRSALQDPIDKYLNFGAIQPGVPLSASQAQQVNTAAGVKIDGVLSTVGYYLQILPATAQVRGLRGSPPMKFWYTDGGSIQSLLLASIDVQ
jgi:hypothetical protein